MIYLVFAQTLPLTTCFVFDKKICLPWVFQGNTEEMKHASLAVSTIITVLALVKTALKSACTTLTSWLLRCID